MNVHAILVVEPDRARPPREIPLQGEEWLTIGREATTEIALVHTGVSRHHARLCERRGRLVVEDLGSLNGTVVIGADGREKKIEPRSEHELDPRETIKIGPFLILPCEMAGGKVLLTPHDVFGMTAEDPDVQTSGTTTVGDELAGGSRLQQVVNRDYDGDPIDWVVAGFLELSAGERAFLFSVEGDRLSRRADRGVDGPVVISERFLRATAERDSAWSVIPRQDLADRTSSESLMGYGPEVRLTGIPIRGPGQQTAAVVYVESKGIGRPDLSALTAFARVAAPIIELHAAFDRESRRREALEQRVGPSGSRGMARKPRGEITEPVGENPDFRRAVETVLRAARTRTTVILRGPSGSGKDVLARLLHESSDRNDQPFVVLNAAALPESLVESELFGHKRGSFTGAVSDAPGAFARADGGTLFLDEIGDLSLTAQAKILRVIETEEVRPLGGTPRRIDVRLVTATHRDLEAMVAEGSFREDLFYRLRVIEVHLPPLAERPEDVIPLAEHFLRMFRRPDGESVAGFSPGAVRLLTRYRWPGNIRELRNVIERAVVLDRDGAIDLDDLTGLPVPGNAGPSGASRFDELLEQPWPEARKRFEKRFFETALSRNEGRVAETARQIDVTRRTVTSKIREHRIKLP